MRCTTASGPYRCMHELDANGTHAGDCECSPDPDAPPGPAGHSARASVHLRAILDVADAYRLDGIGVALKVLRHAGEPDAAYRERLWAAR